MRVASEWEWGRDLPKSRADLITWGSDPFPPGYTAITAEEDPVLGQGVDFGIHVLGHDDQLELTEVKESAWVLLHGSARVDLGGIEAVVERRSLFDEAPTVLHLGPGTRLRLQAQSEHVEWAVARVTNPLAFASRVFWPQEIVPEYRGLGLAQGTCLRNVRLVFDRKARPESRLVLGEVVNYPGRWSSYPPHHHAQPEIYHYRFSAPHGYGHGEAGNRVYKVRQNDTLRIAAQQDHAQVAAPGYAMYYLWIVRHLEGTPYAGFEYATEHTWVLDPAAPIWEPVEGPLGRPRLQPSPSEVAVGPRNAKAREKGTARKKAREADPSGAQAPEPHSRRAKSSRGRSHAAKSHKAQSPEAQSHEVRSQEAQTLENQSHAAQPQEAQPPKPQSHTTPSHEAQSSDAQSHEAQSHEADSPRAHEASDEPRD